MRRGVLAVLALCLAVGAALVAALSLDLFDQDLTTSPTAELSEQCGDVPENATRLTLTAPDGFALGAAVVGSRAAEVGLVLRQGSSQTICEWLPWAGRVAEETDARVLLFDRRGRGSSPGEGDLSKEAGDTRIALDYLTNTGAVQSALAASSMGNSIMFSALPDVAPCVVVSISPVLTASDNLGVVDGSRLTALPSNVWVTWETGNSGVVANAERIVDKAGLGGVTPHSLAIATDDHSIALLENHEEVQDFFLDAVRSCSAS